MDRNGIKGFLFASNRGLEFMKLLKWSTQTWKPYVWRKINSQDGQLYNENCGIVLGNNLPPCFSNFLHQTQPCWCSIWIEPCVSFFETRNVSILFFWKSAMVAIIFNVSHMSSWFTVHSYPNKEMSTCLIWAGIQFYPTFSPWTATKNMAFTLP